ncbi:MAG TPA: ATP-binding protein [Marmoricola sp.]|nr:ATP-binding protein [Marmoricola sp.]
MPARVIVIAGPSGSGKSRLSRRLGLPVLNLDDFYKDGDDPTLPRLDLAGGDPIVDWDDPASWLCDDAVATIEKLCTGGCADIPVYDIARSARVGHRVLELGDGAHFVAEGIFAHEIVAACRARDLLADAICLDRLPALVFALRLTRDLREHRKAPWLLLRRGLHLMWQQRSLVGRAEAVGCRVLGLERAYAELRAAATPT